MQPNFLNKEKKQALPFSLHTLSVRDYQGIKNLEITDFPCDVQWIFLVGENGFGKTSVLRAMTVTFIIDELELYMHPPYNFPLPYRYFDSKKNNYTAKPPLVAYGISRFNMSLNKKADSDNTASLFRDDVVLENIETEIILWYNDTSKKRYETIRKLLCDLIPALADIKLEYNEKTKNKEIFYYEKNDGGVFNPVTFSQLATGFRNIIAMVGDMLIRLRLLQREGIDIENYNEYEGVVLIDEFDAHLHPKYQYELPKLLSSVFPKVQFIVSTHSPIPLLGAPKDSAIVLNVNRTVADGITVERMDEKVPFDHLQPNALLTSPIFGFETLFPRDTPASAVASHHHYQDVAASFDYQKELQKLKEEGLL